ncbi:hypothetical protein ACIA8E_07525 [Streptomyces sp. NPDC051664]|uniref:hypothetical protein n=1 Tax=Streptomyces sp. NPDC051664 TaxID=3365668 RepID=UPI0037954F30
MSGTAGSITASQPHGETLGADLDLQAVASGTWAATTAQVVLPEAGTYTLSVDCFSEQTGTTPWAVAVNARLFNVTDGVPVGAAHRLQYVNINDPGGGTVMALQNAAAFSTFLTVIAPTTVRVEGMRQHVGFNDSRQAHVAAPRLGFVRVAG